ncbi:hypothetical protein, partial [Streptomyces sp. NPDC056227]|uniref:hypothetical protein n=1 Tax=Streptomyces sp. NPDC056227 TaxID=3345753 RepID=UPI0035D5FE1C
PDDSSLGRGQSSQVAPLSVKGHFPALTHRRWDQGNRHKLDLTFPQWMQAWLDGHLTHTYMEARQLQDESWVGPWANE